MRSRWSTPAPSPRLLLGGCILEENWVGGETGTSFNMYDERTARWTQAWVDSRNNTLVTAGGWNGSQMVLQGPRGSLEERITWTPRANGTVRQLAESSSDGGASWTTRYDFIYTPRS